MENQLHAWWRREDILQTKWNERRDLTVSRAAVRDSKVPDGAKLMVSQEAWRAFLTAFASSPQAGAKRLD